jgi:hypothetical protein
MASKVFFKPFVTIPLARTITGVILHFRLHIPCIYTHKLLYFNLLLLLLLLLLNTIFEVCLALHNYR